MIVFNDAVSGGQSDIQAEQYYTPGGTPPVTRRHATPVPSELNEEVAENEFGSINERWEQQSQRSRKSDSTRRPLQEDLDEVDRQSNVVLPIADGSGLSPAQSLGSVARSAS